MGIPHEVERGVHDDSARCRVEAARGSLVELEDVTVVGIECSATRIPPHKDLGADAHLGGGEADPGGSAHGIDHVGDEVGQRRVEGLDGGGKSVEDRCSGDADR